MLISHRHRFLYHVVPKCASATLRQSLAPFADIGWPVSNYQQHMTIADFAKTDLAGKTSGYFRFTFVRNPYDRLYSGYLQDRHAGENYGRWITAKKPIFDTIGDDFPRYFREYVEPADRLTDWRWICFCPMTAFACEDGRIVLDFVGHAETLEEDLSRLGDRLGIAVSKAPDHNVRNGHCAVRPKYLQHYDRATVEAVNRIYADDFALFGYDTVDPADFPQRPGG